jgi:peptidoglycan/LPS O-acetylase OafA/YrhL
VFKNLNTVQYNSKSSYLLDLLRFFAAFMVLLHHVGMSFNTGYQFVMVFFVLSGYFIANSVLSSVNNDKWSWKIYLVNRITRLWIVLIPALLLTAFWAYLQIFLFGHGDFYEGTLEWNVLLGNLFFLQGQVIPLFGQNGPLWSLTYEFWYYILFPCLVLVFKSKNTTSKLIYLLASIGMIVFLGEKIMFYFLIWLLGALVAVLKPMLIDNKVKRANLMLLASLLSVVSLKALYMIQGIDKPEWTKTHYLPDLTVGITFAFVVYLIVSFYNTESTNKHFKWFKVLAGFSYSLYLLHYPILNFVHHWKVAENLNPLIFNLVIGPVTMVFIVIYSYIIAQYTEQKTGKVKKFILNKMSFKPVSKKSEVA